MIQIEPKIKVELVDGTDTWITFVYLRQRDSLGAKLAAGEAFALFVANLEKDSAQVDLHLKELMKLASRTS